MSTLLPPTIEALLDKHFNQALTPEELAQLEAWLAESPDHADAFAKAGLAHGLTREVVKKQVAALGARKKSLLFSPMALIAASAILVVGLGILGPTLGVAKRSAPASHEAPSAFSDFDGVPAAATSAPASPRYVAAVKIEDLSQKINLNTASKNALAQLGGESTTRGIGTDGFVSPEKSSAPAAPVIIRTASLRLRADDAHATARKIEALATSLGGFVSRSLSQGEARRAASAQVEIRVPAAALDQARAQIRAMGTVLADSTTATEVGDQLVDLAARIANLETAEKELRQLVARMADKSDKTAEIMVAYRELTDVRSQIETLKAQEKNLKDRVALSTLTTEIFEEPPPPSAPEGWSAWRPFQSAWAMLVGLAQAAWSLGAYLLVVGIPVVLLIGGAAWMIRRKWKNKP